MFLEVSNVRKSYGTGDSKVDVLKGVDLSIKQGTICTILGPSGSGKSTLLNIIGGLETVDSGKIVIDNNEISNLNSTGLSKYRRDTLGFIFQF